MVLVLMLVLVLVLVLMLVLVTVLILLSFVCDVSACSLVGGRVKTQTHHHATKA